MIGIPVGLAVTNMGEWFIHKYVLHGLGRDKKSFWSFHWHDHHRASRKHVMVDDQYVRPLLRWAPQGKEVLALAVGAAAMAPMFPVAPFFTGTIWYGLWNYYRVHKRAHLDETWAKEHLPWHYDHHMGRDQDANWCVTHPWFDHVMKTRKRYEYSAPAVSKEVPEPSAAKGFFGRAIDGLREARQAVKKVKAHVEQLRVAA